MLEYMTYSEVAKEFNVHAATVGRWVKSGDLQPGPSAGRTCTVTRRSVEDLKENEVFIMRLEHKRKPTQDGTNKIAQHNAEINEISQRILDEIIQLRQEVKDLREELKSAKLQENRETQDNAIMRNTVQKNAELHNTSQGNAEKSSNRTFPEKNYGFSLSYNSSKKVWEASRNIDGKRVRVYIGKNKGDAEERIKAKLIKIGRKDLLD